MQESNNNEITIDQVADAAQQIIQDKKDSNVLLKASIEFHQRQSFVDYGKIYEQTNA